MVKCILMQSNVLIPAHSEKFLVCRYLSRQMPSDPKKIAGSLSKYISSEPLQTNSSSSNNFPQPIPQKLKLGHLI